MPMYDARGIFRDPILSGFSVGYQDQQLIGDNLFPTTPVPLPSGQYRVFDRSQWVTWPDRREPGTVANEVRGAKWSIDTFSAHEHSLQAAVTDEERQYYTAALGDSQTNLYIDIDPEQDAVKLITRSVLLSYELLCANTARNAALYPSGHTVTLSGTAQWTDPASDPMSNIITGMNSIYTDIFLYPNTMIIPWTVWLTLRNHPKIISRYQYVSPTYDPVQAIQAITGFAGNIVIANQFYNAADNIDAAPSMTSIWGKDVILAYVDPQMGQRTFTFGKTFTVPYPSAGIRAVDRWREEPRKSDVFRVSQVYDLKIVSALAGYLIKNVVP